MNSKSYRNLGQCFTVFLLISSISAQAKTDVIGLKLEHLTPEFWIAKLDSNNPIASQESIDNFNQSLIRSNKNVFDPLATANSFTKQQLLEIITSISKKPKYERFYENGKKLTDQDYQHYLSNLSLNNIPDFIEPRFALVTQRTSLRMLPTLDRVFNAAMDLDIDRFQETAVFPGDAVAILHTSNDKEWYFVRHYHYQAWVQAKHIAIGDREEIQRYKDAHHNLLITAAKVFTNFNPINALTSEVQLEMGSRFPLASNASVKHNLNGQNPFASHVMLLPTRNSKGLLDIQPSLVARHYDTSPNYLAYTPSNLIKQSFKFLGERYGWGHDFNGRDCTGFISEIFKSFGIIMPRNSGQQGYAEYAKNFRFESAANNDEKLAFLKNDLRVGDLIYLPGHVAMFIGYEANQPYVIHDVKGLNYYDSNNNFYQGELNGVSITPLLPLHLSDKRSYVDAIYNVKRIEFTT